MEEETERTLNILEKQICRQLQETAPGPGKGNSKGEGRLQEKTVGERSFEENESLGANANKQR